ncbi:TonB-dependent receptor [Pedobacter riviphilus]|uniref:TonB-dependent receptor n=1 Tax=Pedobacter riviphilus TaxID=2766984 RepID=A0ABX6THU9_9SPHI|nr:TonB-dependent receptor [Pedobacter riviphilus]QNR85051.1 TonB-dependent receptor [Pedobacter riviphilus]
MRRILLFSVFLLTVFSSSAQQSKMITGTVTDQKTGETLAGVSISIKGTAKGGVTTRAQGEYSISVPADQPAVLVFRYVGYHAKEVTVNQQKTINVALTEQNNDLDQVVVVGYGSVAKKDLTGSVSSVKMAELNKAPVRSFDEALAGRVAGVQVTSADGRPGSGVDIVIRGNNSVTQANSPLYVVDGFPIEDPNNNVVNPADIESIDILKDASATAIYGARGANGVVVITTKKGKQGKPVFSFSSTLGVQRMTKKMEMMSPYEYVKYQLELTPALTGTPATPTQIYLADGKTLDYYNGVNAIDWQDLVSRTALYNNNDFAVRGGTKKLKYAVSTSTVNQNGILLNSNYQRYTGRAVLDYAITDKLKIGVNANYSFLKQKGIDPTRGENGATTNVMTSILGMRPVPSELFDLEDAFQDPDMNAANDYRINPVINLQNSYNVTNTHNITANGYAEYAILKDLKLRSSFGIVENKAENDVFNNTKTSTGRPGGTNGVNGKITNNNYSNWLNENTLTWDKKISKKSKLNLLGGFTLQKRHTWSNGRSVTQLPNEDLMFDGFDQGVQQRVDPSASDWTMASFLGRINYNYDSKYLFTASYRADGSSKFPSQNHWGYFPSAAIAWRFDQENFLKKSKILSEGKLRVSYGQTGNNRVGDFDYLTNYFNPIVNTYTFNNEYVPGVIPTKLGNSDLKWETTEQVDAGIDLGFFKQRISFSADVYRKTTKDLLLNTQLPPSAGFGTALKNIGSVENRGLELTLTTQNIVTKDFTWSTNANIAFNRNKLISLAEGQKTLESTINWDAAWRNVSAYVAEVGQPLGSMYGYEWLGTYKYADFNTSVNGSGVTVYTLKPEVATNGNTRTAIQPGDIKYKDQNGDGVVNAQDYVKIGNGLPAHTGGFSNNFTYKGFDLNIFFQWSYGNDLLNVNKMLFEGNSNNLGNFNQYASYENRWTPQNSEAEMFRTRGFFGGGYSSNYVEDGSYLRLKTVSLGYNLDPKVLKKVYLKTLRFFVSAQNLATWTKYSGADPEVNTYRSVLTPGFDFSAYPRARTVVFGTNLTF